MVHHGSTLSQFNHYEAAKKLADYLEINGHAVEAQRLKSAMEDGATGTEIFMNLRFHLRDVIQRIPMDSVTLAAARQLFEELDRALGP